MNIRVLPPLSNRCQTWGPTPLPPERHMATWKLKSRGTLSQVGCKHPTGSVLVFTSGLASGANITTPSLVNNW